jgi:lipoprotein Spr
MIKTLIYSSLTIFVLSSCGQLKTLTSLDTSTERAAEKKSGRKVQFLDDISVTSGQRVTSRHASIGPNVPKSMKFQETIFRNETVPNYTAADAERGNWLQLKYALLLDASPESLTNTYLLKLVDEWWGTRYSLGGTTKDGVDCSGFSQIVIGNLYNLQLPRTAQEQYQKSEKIKDEELREGDLVFFHTGGRAISHVGVYLKNNKFVHASTSQGVMISDLADSYWSSKYKGGGRVVEKVQKFD